MALKLSVWIFILVHYMSIGLCENQDIAFPEQETGEFLEQKTGEFPEQDNVQNLEMYVFFIK